MKSQRKAFSKELYEEGSKAEIKVMDEINKHPENFEHNGITLAPGNFLCARNSNKYDVDLIVLVKDKASGLYSEAFGVEVVRRSNIDYGTIFIEGNKTRYYKDGLPIMVIVVNMEMTKALVLDTDKPISGFPSKLTNYNTQGTDELNYLVPRSEFIEWDFNAA